MTNRKFLSFLLAIFMVVSTFTPLFAENDSVTVLPPRMAEEEEPQNIVIIEDDKERFPIIDKSEEGGKIIEGTPEKPEIEEDNSPVILENREENNNVVILPPIRNEEELEEEETKETSEELGKPEEPKDEKEKKKEVKVQILSKRDAKKPASEGEVNLVLLNDNPADINEEVYDEKIRWKESDFKIEEDKIISLSDEGLLKAKTNKKLIIPEMENVTIVEKQAFKGLSLRSVEISKNIKEIKDEAFLDNDLKSVKILGKGKEISKNAFNEELVEEYGKNEDEEFLYEFESTDEDELEIGEEIVGDAVEKNKTVSPSYYFKFNSRIITGLTTEGIDSLYGQEIVFPPTNTSGEPILAIAPRAFQEKYFTGLDFSFCPTLQGIGAYAFSRTSVQSVNFSNLKNLKIIDKGAFEENQIEKVDLSDCNSLQTIGDGAFYQNMISTLNLNNCNSLTSIGNSSFGVNELSYLDLSVLPTLQSVGREAFGSNHLKSATIPLSLRNLDNFAFSENPGLNSNKQVYLYTPTGENPNELRDSNYHKINPELEIKPDSSFLYTFKDNVITGLSGMGKEYYSNNHHMILPGKNPQGENIIGIGQTAFSKINLQSVDFSKLNNLEYIDMFSFSENKLSKLDLSNNLKLKNISSYAFSDNVITDIKFSAIERLGIRTFGSNLLESITIPLSLRQITNDTFYGNSGSNDKHQVFLNTPDGTNPNNLENSNYHLINPKLEPDDVSLYTFDGTAITGLSEKGKKYFAEHHDMVLPGKNPQGQAITAIGSWAFSDESTRIGLGLTSVDFSNCTSLKTIGTWAFYKNKLTSINLSKSTNLTSIYQDAFRENQLTNLDLSGCINLTNIGDSAFKDNQLTGVDLSECKSLTIIGGAAFQKNQLKNLNLSGCSSLAKIGQSAFSRNQLTSLNLSGLTNLTSIGGTAFVYNKLTNLNLSGLTRLTSIGGRAFSENQIASLDLSGCTNLTSIGAATFAGNQLAKLDLSECTSLTSIGFTAFAGNKLKTSKIPLSLKTIADKAFNVNPGNNDKKQVYLYTPDYTNPNNLKDTDYHLINPITGSDDVTLYTFNGTTITGLSERGKKYFETHHDMKLPGKNPQGKAITEIGEKAFSDYFDSYALTSADFSNCKNLISIGSDAFSFNNLKSIDLSGCTNLKDIESQAFYKNQIISLDLSECTSLTSIGDDAFGYNQLTNLDLSKCISLTSIGGEVFKNNRLKTAQIPLSLKNLAGDAFKGNLGQNDYNSYVYLYTPDYTNPNNLKDSGYHLINPVSGSDDVTLYTFDGTTITGLTERGKKYFKENPNIKLPGKNPQGESITAIADNAFSPEEYDENYPVFESIDFSNCSSLLAIGNGAFAGHYFDKLDLSPCTSLIAIGDSAFAFNEGSHGPEDKDIEVSFRGLKNLKTIGESAFAGPDIGNRVGKIDFSGCTGLETIGEGAFFWSRIDNLDLSSCTNLKTIKKMAFMGTDLKTLNLSGCKNLITIEETAFHGNKLNSIDFSGCSNLQTIGSYAFAFSSLKTLDLSKCTSLKVIEKGAFYNGKINIAYIPLSLITLADNAFQDNPGNNDKKQVYLYTPDYTNPNNLKDTNYHLINPITGSDDVTLYTFDGTTITGLSERGKEYFKENHEMILPAKTPDGQNVIGIGEKAFYNNGKGYGLTKVDFSNCISITSIDNYAFNSNKITSLDLSECTKLTSIGNSAFSGNQLTSLNLLGCTSLEVVGSHAFWANQLTNLNLSGCKSLKNIETFAFNNNQITDLDLSGCINLTHIGYRAFALNKLTNLDLSGCTNLTTIEVNAFADNQLKIAKIPLSLKTLADDAFKYNIGNNDKKQVYLYTPDYTNPNNLQDTEYHLINPITGSDDVSLYTFDDTIITGLSERGQKYFETHHDMKLPAKNPEGEFVTEIGKSAFNGKNLKSVDFSNCSNLVKIGPWAFTNNYITNLDLSPCQNLNIIAEHAFDNSHIDKIDLSNLSKLETIENEAFNNNQSTSLTFKNNTNLKNIGKFAFNQNNLTTLDLSGCPNLLNIEEGVFSGGNIASLDLSVVPNISFIGRAAFSDNQITSVNLSGCKNLKSIGEIAFIKNKITDLDLSPCENLEEIGSYSFSENGLNSVNFKGLKNLKTIKYGAFMVNNIKIVDFSDCANLVNLEEAVFYKNKIESLDMSKCISLKNIPGWIFGENQLKTAKISSSITSIDESSFANNPGNNAKNQVYLYTPRRNNPMNLKDTDYHLVDPITFTIKKVDAKGNPMEGVEFAFYKVERPTPPAPPAPPQNGTSKTDDTELEISSENVSPAVGGPTITMPDIDLNLNPDGPIPEFFPDPKTVVGVKPIFMTATTDKNGTAEITLPYSPYFLTENKTIPGYSINNTVTQIDATMEGKTITYTDYEVSIEVPETGTLGIIPYILLALILVGGAYVVLRQKKEEEKK